MPLPALRGVKGLLARHPRPSGATRSDSRTRATWRASLERALAVPFIDYARADGLAIGPGQSAGWTPGADRRHDRLGGRLSRAVRPRHARPLRRRTRAGRPEVRARRAPSGSPGTTRSASPASSKVAPPYRQPAVLRERLARLTTELPRPRRNVTREAEALPPLEAEVRALSVDASLAIDPRRPRAELAAAEASLRAASIGGRPPARHDRRHRARARARSSAATSARRPRTSTTPCTRCRRRRLATGGWSNSGRPSASASCCWPRSRCW